MTATTYSISVNEETARRFETVAAAQGMEPSEVLCHLVRQFVDMGGFSNEPSDDAGKADDLKKQASEWLNLRAAHANQHMEDAQSSIPDSASEILKERKRLPWEDPSDTIPPWKEAPSPKLPWED